MYGVLVKMIPSVGLEHGVPPFRLFPYITLLTQLFKSTVMASTSDPGSGSDLFIQEFEHKSRGASAFSGSKSGYWNHKF